MVLAAAQTAHAQDRATSADDDGRVADIVVTAQKVSQNVNDVGMSITALKSDALTQQGVTSPEQLTRVVPGLNVTYGGYGLPVYTMRGVGVYDVVAGAAPAVSLYLDETPLPYPIMSRSLAMDVQRVEVLKGPQGTLFGQNSTGGAINFIANRPTDTLAAGVEVGISSYDRINIDGFVSGPISDSLRLRIAGRADHGGDWQRSTTRDDSHGTRRFYAGRVLLDWDASERTRFQFGFNGWLDRSDEQAGQFMGLVTQPARIRPPLAAAAAQYSPPTNARQADWDPTLTTGYIDRVTGNVAEGYQRDDDFYQLSLRGDHELTDDMTLTSITSWSEVNQRSFIDTDGTNATIYNVPNTAYIDAFSQEVRLAGKSGAAQWQIGANYARDVIDMIGSAYNAIGTHPFRSATAVAYFRVRSMAVFAHVDYALSDTVNLVAGIRYTDVNLRNRGCTVDTGDGTLAAAITTVASRPPLNKIVSIPAGGCATLLLPAVQPGWVVSKLNENNVPFNVGLNWKVTPDSLIYASIRRGYKAGAYSPNGATTQIALDPATQERLMAYEAGFKLGLADRRVQLNGAIFHYNYADKQIRGKMIDPTYGASSKTVNVPTSRINGAEVELTVVPSSQFRATAAVSYTDSKITGSFRNTVASGLVDNFEMAGQSLPLTPKWQAQADAEYTISVGTDASAFLGGHFNYQDNTFGGVGEEAIFKIDSYSTLDLRAGVRAEDGKWSVTAYVNNVTNKYSWNAVNLSGPDAVTRIANLPRIVGVRAALKY